MKISDNFVLREIAGEYIVVPVGSATLNFNGMITVNESGMFLWKLLQKEQTQENLVNRLMEEYEVDEKTATEDVKEFLNKLRASGIV